MWIPVGIDDPERVEWKNIKRSSTPIGGGSFRYIYALMNFDFDPQFKALALDLPDGLPVSNITFSDAENGTANDWVAAACGGQLALSCISRSQKPAGDQMNDLPPLLPFF